jgi:hypothetical protein
MFLQAADQVLNHSPIIWTGDTPIGWVTLNDRDNPHAYNHAITLTVSIISTYSNKGVAYVSLVLSYNQQKAFCNGYGKEENCSLVGLP